jgi:hypothetical protein
MAAVDFVGTEILFGHLYTSNNSIQAYELTLTLEMLDASTHSGFISIEMNSGDIHDPEIGDNFSIRFFQSSTVAYDTSTFYYKNIGTLEDPIYKWVLNNYYDDTKDPPVQRDANFDIWMEEFILADYFSGGVIALYSPINEKIDYATKCIDGDLETYETIGTNSIRYVMHDFGGDKDNALYVKKISWVIESDVEKSYSIEAWDGNEWQLLKDEEHTDGIRKITPGISEKSVYSWEQAQPIYAVRLYYRGDSETNSPNIDIAISNVDDGSGTEAYQISSYPDFRDVEIWTETTDGVTYKTWDLTENTNTWELLWDSDENITCVKQYNNAVFFGCESGKLYYLSYETNSTGTITEVNDFSSQINVIYTTDETIYVGTKDGKVYSSTTGLSWGAPIVIIDPPVNPLLRNGILSLAYFSNHLYIGTDYNRIYKFDEDTSEITNIKVFSDNSISTMTVHGSTLYIGTSSSGKIFTHNGTSYSLSTNTEVSDWKGSTVFSYDDLIYFYGDNGKIYRYNSGWELFYDSYVTNINNALNMNQIGPPIVIAYEDTSVSGKLPAGNYKYALTYVDLSDNESLLGPITDVTILNSINGSTKLSWNEVNDAKYYNVYRTTKNDQAETFIKRLASSVTTTEYSDTGSRPTSTTSPPSTSKGYLWFGTDKGKFYVYDKNAILQLSMIEDIESIDAIAEFYSSILISGKETGSETSKVYKFTGRLISTGTQTVYARSKDVLGNISETKSDSIYLNMLYKNSLIEVDSDSNIVDIYESDSSPQLKLSSPSKQYYAYGVYESTPYYAANLSSWDLIQYLIYLDAGSIFEIYARSADTATELESASWYGPATESLIDPDEYFYDIEGTEYDYYYHSGTGIKSGTFDISSLKDKWVQFRIVLKTEEKDLTPYVYSIVLRYNSTNATYFFTNIFNLEEKGEEEGYENPDEILIKRGLLTYNGSVPLGGKIEFGITTSETSHNWQDYQIITPDIKFDMETLGNKFRIGILLSSVVEEASIVHEWALSFDTGEKTVRMYQE